VLTKGRRRSMPDDGRFAYSDGTFHKRQLCIERMISEVARQDLLPCCRYEVCESGDNRLAISDDSISSLSTVRSRISFLSPEGSKV
jgi:hypothetical protein